MAQGSRGSMVTDQGPIHITVIGNSFTEAQGVEYLKAYRLRETAASVMFVAECCKALVAVRNGHHHPVQFILHDEFCKLTSPKHEVKRENDLCRFHTQHWDKAHDPQAYELPPFNGPQIHGEPMPWHPPVRTWLRRRFCLRNPKM